MPIKTHSMEISSNISLQNKFISPRIIKLYLKGRYQQQRELIVTDFDHNATLLLWEHIPRSLKVIKLGIENLLPCGWYRI